MIDIILSTYNGEKFLKEQLDSILNQTFSDWKLIIRDDGSSDATLSIINNYIKKYSNRIRIIKSSQNLGVIKSFECLLKNTTSPYIMFCDQDDIWLPTKIEESLLALKFIEKRATSNTPILIHSDLILINKEGLKIADSFWEYANIRPKILNNNPKYLAISNSVTGCTMLINESAKKYILPFPSKIYMHDAWISMCICKNGIIQAIPKQLTLYRQHGNNTIGAIAYNYSIITKIKKIKTTFRKAIEMYSYNKDVYKGILDFWITKLIYFFKIHNKE